MKMGDTQKSYSSLHELDSHEFRLSVNKHVEDIIYSLPEPEFRELLEKSGDYRNLKSSLSVFVSVTLASYAMNNNLNPVGLNWGLLNVNIVDAINNLKEGKNIIEGIDDILDFITTVNSVDELLTKISSDEDGSVVFDLFDEIFDAI